MTEHIRISSQILHQNSPESIVDHESQTRIIPDEKLPTKPPTSAFHVLLEKSAKILEKRCHRVRLRLATSSDDNDAL